MQVDAGSRLGPYEIISRLGAGGMGEVWQARDTRLSRNVAIKIVAPSLAADDEFLRRFEHEARMISKLNHPNICTLHDVGDGYLVMELLSGETLAERVARGPLPLTDVLRIGIEVGSALAAAHRQGLVHRDLKPGNVMLTKSGAKLLDFGLAKGAEISITPDEATRQRPITAEGSIIGTFQYMAPEQLEGQDADPRSDIFALGALLYETATGRRAFEGKTKTSLIASIVAGQPKPVHELQPLAPASLEHVISTCLAKEPDERWQSASDVAAELRWISATRAEQSAGASPRPVLPWLIALLAVIAASIAIVSRREKPRAESAMQFTSVVPAAHAIRMPAISPDGKSIAFVADDASGQTLLWVRRIDSTLATPLGGTKNARFPLWSPDARHVAFFADGILKKVDLSGGTPQQITTVRNGRGAAWNRDGDIIFASAGAGPLSRVSASGGAQTILTKLDTERGESSHRWPLFLPDGRHYLFTIASFGTNRDTSRLGVYVGSLDSSEQKMLIRAPSNIAYADGFILFVRDGTLNAQRFDEKRLEVSGEPMPIATGIRQWASLAWSDFAAVGPLLVYQTAPAPGLSQFVWFDRAGKETGRLPDRNVMTNPRLSPTGDRLLYDAIDPASGNIDVWLASTTTALRQRLTFGAGNDAAALWSPDGTSVTFTTYVNAAQAIARRKLGGPEEIITVSSPGGSLGTLDISSDGDWTIFRDYDSSSEWDVKALRRGEKTARKVLATTAAESDARCSPNGKWLAYVSNESGRPEVYVTTFPQPSVTWQASTSGGTDPHWRRDGRELFFLDPEKRIVSVAVGGLTTLELGTPQPLFRAPVRELISGTDVWSYDVSADGRRFLVNAEDIASADVPLTFSVHWDEALRR